MHLKAVHDLLRRSQPIYRVQVFPKADKMELALNASSLEQAPN